MTDICKQLVIHCPDYEALHYLTGFLADHEEEDGTVRMALRLPISKFADRRPLIERPVVATFFRLQSTSDLYPAYSVTWLPKGDGSSPEFAGAIVVEKTARDDRFGLILSGQYTPPHEVGERFGPKRGRRLARVPALDVLRAIADYVEYAFAHNEAALAGHRPHSTKNAAQCSSRTASPAVGWW